MAHRLHVVVTINDESLCTAATLAVDDRIARTDAKRARADAHSLHRLFDRLRDRTHARATRSHGRHAAEILQTLRKAARVSIYIAVKLCKGHALTLRLSAYLCVLCVSPAIYRRERRDTQRAAEKNFKLTRWV